MYNSPTLFFLIFFDWVGYEKRILRAAHGSSCAFGLWSNNGPDPGCGGAQQPRRADSYYHFSLARLRDAEGRFTEAIDEYKKALDLDPKNSTLYSQMAQTYLKKFASQ